MEKHYPIDIIPGNILIIDKNGFIQEANKSAKDLLGLSVDDFEKKNLFDFVSENVDEIQNEKLTLDLLTSSSLAEYKLKVKNNHTIYVSLSISSLKMEKIENELYIIHLFDLTLHKMKAELIKQSQLRFENIANSAPVMIWIADINGLFIFVNKFWTDFTGKPAGEELGLSWTEEVHPNDLKEFFAVYNAACLNRKEFSFQLRLKRFDGEFRWLIMKGIPRFNDSEMFSGLIGTCIDITQQKTDEETIRMINNELQNANKNKDKFFSIISHDLRSPLSGIMTLMDILQNEYSSLEHEEIQEIIREAALTSKNTFNLMENLLDWSRIQTGKMIFDPQYISLTLIVRGVQGLFSQKLKSKSISLNLDFEPEIFAFADLQMTETVFRNLISNAIKFTPQFGLIIISFEILDKNILVKIKDTGVGMDEEQLSKIFRLDSTYSTIGTAGERGTGLGLMLCKELIEKQGGKIWVESAVNSGTTFSFTLPGSK